jgi:PST family polysaccharide transporter
MLTSLISVKVMSIIIGPAGVALIGQLTNFLTIIFNLASGGINNGVVKYVSENKTSDSKIRGFISTAFKITLYCCLFVGIILIFFHNQISRLIMFSVEYGYVFIVLGVTIFMYALNNLLLSVINGYKEYKRYVTVNIANSVVGLVFSVSCVYFWGLKGALISAVTYQSVVLFFTLRMIKNLLWYDKTYFFSRFDKKIFKKYLHYTLMAFITAAMVPVSQLILRSYVISNISDTEAGWWEAMNQLSKAYLMIVTSSIGVYYLPRLAELTGKVELRGEIFKTYKIIMPLLLAGFAFIYVLRFIIIRLVFTSEFLPMENLFMWQLSADFFKIASWLLAFLMIAKSMTIAFITTEILFSTFFIALSLFFIRINGVLGITQAYLVNCLLYFLTMLIMFNKFIFNKK